MKAGAGAGASVGCFFKRRDVPVKRSLGVAQFGMMVGLWLGMMLAVQADSANEAGDACTCSERTASATDLLPAMNGTAADFAERRAGAVADARIRIAVDRQGVYQVNASELVAKGVALSDLVGASLRLYNRDREIPIEVSTSGAFSGGDSFRFYGEGIDATYTYDNAYWLATQAPAGAAPPLRWNSVPGSMMPASATPTVTTACRQFTADEHIADIRNIGTDDDGWALGVVANSSLLGIFQTVSQAIPDLGTPNPLGTASLEVTFFPRTSIASTDYNFSIRNGAGVSVLSTNLVNPVRGLPTTFTAAINPTLIDATLVFDSTDGHLYELDKFTLRYDRILTPVNGRLGFGGVAGSANYTIAGAGSGTPLLLDISNPSSPVQVQGALAGGSYTFGHASASTNAPCFFYSEQTEVLPAAGISVAECANLADPRRQADWILIAPEAWMGSQGAGDLLRHRAAYTNPGLPAAAPLNVLAVTVESIYNEFGYGVKDAAAIKQFLGYAHHHFQAPAPRFVLLGGDAAFDARQDIETEPDLVPTWFDPEVSHADTDSWYARVAGTDRIADFAIGRWPVQSAVEFDAVAAKTIAADIQAADAFRTRVMLVHDESPTKGGMVITNFTDCTNTLAMLCLDFPAFTAGLATNVPAPYTVNLQSLATDGTNVFAINSAIREAFQGPLFGPVTTHGFIDFFGQASRGKWGLKIYSEAMLDSADVPSLSNSAFPIVNMYGSLTGQITADNQNGGRPMMTRLLVKPDGGAAGGMANAWLLDSDVAQVLQTSFYAQLQSGTGQRLGDLWLAQSQAAGAAFPQPTGVVVTGEESFGQWTLFGDPALMLP